jgi:Zn-dependent protease
MHASWTFGKIFGIPIGAHSGWLLLFILATWSLAGSYFPGKHPGWPLAAYWLAGMLTSLLFFISLLLHELGHAVVAQHEGVPVRGITLFLLGGVAQFSREPSTPGAEFRIAAAGPLVSLLLGLWLSWLGSFAGAAAWGAPASYLGHVNLLLAGFNLLPGLPLDGGRLLHATLWAFGPDNSGATRIAARVGLGIASLFMLGGVLQMLNGQLFSGLWIIFIAWFLQNAARQSCLQMELREKRFTENTERKRESTERKAGRVVRIPKSEVLAVTDSGLRTC